MGIEFSSDTKQQEVNPKMKCGVCDEAITQPVGHKQLIRQITNWLAEESPLFIPAMNDLKTYCSSYPIATSCVLSGEDMQICPHCVAKEAFELMPTLTETQKEAFLRQFTYEIYDIDGTSFIEQHKFHWK